MGRSDDTFRTWSESPWKRGFAGPACGWVEESSPPYGAPPEPSPKEVSEELVDAWRALARAESAVALAEGDTLRLVADQRLYLHLGFSSFHDFCVEAAEMTASTGKRRVVVSRLAADVPALREALLDGTMSQCQALALRPVVTAESAPWWIAVAARSSVSELRAAVRQASDAAEATSERTSRSAAGSSEEDPEGRRVSIAAPVAARLAFEEGLELARKALGYDAPRHTCIAAMLAEVAGHGLTSEPVSENGRVRGDECGREKVEHDARHSGGVPELHRAPRSRDDAELHRAPRSRDDAELHGARQSRNDAELHGARQSRGDAELDCEPADPQQRRLQRLCRSQHGVRPFTTSRDSGATSAPGPARAPDSASRPAAAPKSDAASGAVPAALRASLKRAQRTIDQVYDQLDSFRELLEEAPTEADTADPATIVERIEEIRALSAPIHVLSLRVLLHLEDVSAARYLGVRTQDALAETCLRLSPRTFRQLLAEAWQMKRRPEIETAFLSGKVGVSRLRLLSSIEPRRFRKFLVRARRITLRQLKRELPLHEKLVVLRDQLQRERLAQERFAERHQDGERGVRHGNHDCRDRPPVFVLSDRDLDPLPGSDLDVKLACILLQHGHVAQELARNLTRPRLCTAEEAAFLIAKASRLDLHATVGRGRHDEGQWDHRAMGESRDHAGADEFEIYQRDPAANPALMRLLEVLVDLALLSVCDDSVLVGSQVYPRGRQSLNLAGDFCRISFWAPDPVIEDLNRFLENLRQRVGPLPAWAALMLMVRDATDVWKQVDPKKKKPQFWRIFERDEHRCRTPACSKRADLHGHHIKFRSQGGSDDPSNLVSACYGHHQQGVHDGHLRCSGNANHLLRWVMGPRAKRGEPFRVYYGDLRVD